MLNERIRVELKPGDSAIAEEMRRAVDEYFPGYPIEFSFDSEAYGVGIATDRSAATLKPVRDEGADIAHDILAIITGLMPGGTE